jgi:hypothetical protein
MLAAEVVAVAATVSPDGAVAAIPAQWPFLFLSPWLAKRGGGGDHKRPKLAHR